MFVRQGAPVIVLVMMLRLIAKLRAFIGRVRKRELEGDAVGHDIASWWIGATDVGALAVPLAKRGHGGHRQQVLRDRAH